MKIKTYPLGPLSTNCYLVFDEKTREAVIIDPADSGDFLTEKIRELKLNLKAIIATHGHFDHVLASLELTLATTSEVAEGLLRGEITKAIPFLISEKDRFLLPKARARSKFYTNIDSGIDPAKPDQFLKENDLIKFRSEELKVIETPGHSPGSLCFYNQKSGILFSGDTIFKEAVGRTDLPYSSPSQLESSIKKLLKLPDKTIVYPGHGEKTTIASTRRLLAELQGVSLKNL